MIKIPIPIILSLLNLTGINLSFQSQQEVEFVDSMLKRSRKKGLMCDFCLRYWIFGENFCLLEGRKNIFLSASRSQFDLTRPANILKIGQQIKVYGQIEF